MPFLHTSLPDADLLYVAGAGEIDDAAARQAAQDTDVYLHQGEPRRWLIDLRGVRSLDLSWEAIKVCAEAHQAAFEANDDDTFRIGVIGRGTIDSVVVRIYNSFARRPRHAADMPRVSYFTSLDDALVWLGAGDDLRGTIEALRKDWGLPG